MNPEAVWAGKRVLLVDDSATSRTLIAELLRDLPLELEQASGGEQFLELTRSRDYDLILLDLRLPQFDGLELLRLFREHCQTTTVVLITGQASLSTATDALAEGADGYLEKGHLRQGPAALQFALEKAMLQRARRLAQLELTQLKDEFHAVIVHDLRSPAAAASVALRMYQESPRPEVLQSAIRSLDRLFQRLDRYLDFTRMESLAWQMACRPCNLEELLEDVVAQLQPLMVQKRQSLCWLPSANPLRVQVDPDWMLQALENLLANAVKYTPPEGRIELAVQHDSAWLSIEISDNGPGIPLEMQSRLFRRYIRLHSGPSEKGSGLGLLIAKNVAEAHGGSVQLQSSGIAGEGATFRMRLPL